MNYREGKKVWKNLPEVVRAEWNTPHFYTVLGFRRPKAGEWYLSGTPVDAYRTDNDLDTPYLVVRLEELAKRRSYWVRESA